MPGAVRSLLAFTVALTAVVTGATACGDDDVAVTTSAGPSTSPPGTTPNSNLAAVTATGSGAVSLALGQRLVVKLDANATTGYAWVITTAAAAATLALESGPTYTATPTDSPVAGSGGTTSTVFRAMGPGTTTVVLSYRRSFEPAAPDNQTVTLVVTVR
ncbi:MAG: protease inhibitor I42 family protein [Acidimicrobiales bacterium]